MKQFIRWKEHLFAYILLLLFSAVLIYAFPIIGIIALFLALYYIYSDYTNVKKKNEEITTYIEKLNDSFDDITRGAVFAIPFPLVIVDEKNRITWYNTNFKDLINEDLVLDSTTVDSVLAVDPELLNKDIDYISTYIGESYYRFYKIDLDDNAAGIKTRLLYGVDESDMDQIERKMNNTKLCIIELYIDNYDELIATVDETKRVLLFANIDARINKWASNHHAYLRKYESDKFMMILHQEDLDHIIETKFNILDIIREVKDGITTPPTLSIGASSKGNNPLETHENARMAVDVALGRGGDQAVLNVGEEVQYFGGKTKAQEKRNKVKARVISHALEQLIQQADHVFIMGHKNPDMDAFGAGLGVFEACKMQNKKANIVLNEVVPSIENIYDAVIEYNPEYKDVYINCETAALKCDGNSLVVVCDTNRKKSTECPELLDITKNIVMIDHHRRGDDFINNAVLTYMETYASSTCEMVTEILYYMSDKLELPKIVAEALLAGITVDTKNFFYQTGVRTFEAASILKRQGADSIKVKQLFKDDEKTIKLKSDVIANAEVYRGNIAIGVLDESIKESVLIAAQSADELLNILGIEASFVLTHSNDKIHISGRSLGRISVQLILEKIGGGGHLTSAGAQLDTSVKEAIMILKQAIDEYVKEDEITDEGNTN